jgi:hypothetical protein
MNVPEVIISVIILIFSAVVVFISTVKHFTGYKKIIDHIIVSAGFISYYSLWIIIYLFIIKAVIDKGIIPVLTLLIVFIVPLTGVLAAVSSGKIKLFIKNISA